MKGVPVPTIRVQSLVLASPTKRFLLLAAVILLHIGVFHLISIVQSKLMG